MNHLLVGDNLQWLLDEKVLLDESVSFVYAMLPQFSDVDVVNVFLEQESLGWEWSAEADKEYQAICDRKLRLNYASARLVAAMLSVFGRKDISSYIMQMLIRLALAWHKLALNGHLCIRMDLAHSHYMKLVGDAVCCGDEQGAFLGQFFWDRDIVLCYAKSMETGMSKDVLKRLWLRTPGASVGIKEFIQSFTQAGDKVLDLFTNHGELLMMLEFMGREWVGIDKSEAKIQSCSQRLTSTVSFDVQYPS